MKQAAGIALFLVFALTGLPAWNGVGAAAVTEVGTVLVAELNMRAGPGRQYRVLLRLPKDTRVRVVGRESGWLKIDHRGTAGYILEDGRYVRLATIGSDPPATAPTGPGPEALKALRDKADTLQEKLTASRAQIGTMSDQEQALIREVDAAERTLDAARTQVRTTQAALSALARQIEEGQAERALLEEAIRVGETYTAKRLVALYKLHQVGRIHLLASADSFFDLINRKTALERILDQDEVLLGRLRDDQARKEALLEKITTARAEQVALNEALQQRIARLGTEQRNRTALLEKVRGAKALEQAAHKALEQAARELEGALAAVSSGPDPVRTAVAVPEPASGVSFARSKGLLNWPVRGKIITFFGPYRDEASNLVNFQSGINIQAGRGEPIRAVADGYAIFSSWFKGFGNMVIIDHGDHYYTVYAHLEEVFKVKGDRVENGEVIATVGDSGSLMGPALHFQVRHHGKPMDPLDWINKG